MKYILDTNIFLRVLINDNQKMFEDCSDLLLKIKSNAITAILPGIVFSEINWVLGSVYEIDKRTIIRSLKSILKLNGLRIVDNYDYDQALEFFKNKNVKYIDCLIASLAKDKNYTVISYDKDFDKLKIKRLSPNNLSLG